MASFDEIKIAGKLPSPKGVALAIMNQCDRDDCRIEDVARLVQTDPALSGRLLRLANSSGGTHRPVSAINEALLRIGMKSVAQLAMGFSLVDQFKDGPCKAFDYRNYWSRSLLMALASRELGRLTRAAAPEDLFACGLLSNIGSLALATAFPVEYSELLQSARSQNDLLEIEHKAFGIDRRRCTLAMMEDFGIPKALAEPVFYHLSPDESQFCDGSRPHKLTWLFHAAGHLADLGIATEKIRSQLVGSLIRLGGRFQMDADGTAALFDRIVEEWNDWAKLLEVPVPIVPPFDRLSETFTAAGEAKETNDSLRALLVSSNNTSTFDLAACLQSSFGRLSYYASDLDEALNIAVAVLPQVVFVDADFSIESAQHFCRKIRGTEWGQSVYLVALSDQIDKQSFAAAYENGVDACLYKCFGEKALSASLLAVNRHLGLLNAWQNDRAQLKSIASELAVSNRKLEEVARTDMLTGLPNRRGAMEALARAWSVSDRSGEALSVMMIDLDWFKRVNDRYGHAFGDSVLKHVGARLLKEGRRSDALCRIGGEEFLVVCSGSDLRSAMTAGERLRRAIETMTLAARGNEDIKLRAYP